MAKQKTIDESGYIPKDLLKYFDQPKGKKTTTKKTSKKTDKKK